MGYQNMFVLQVTFLLFFVGFCSSLDSSNELCMDNVDSDACQQIERNFDISCDVVASKVDCILNADQGLSTLSVLKPEEAFLGAALVNSQASVIGEILSENAPYHTVVIVKSSYTGGFTGLRGSTYCHPGYDHDELITSYVLEELDEKLAKFSCDKNKTLTEQKFEALSLTFGTSCRPGRWTADDNLDAELKNQYSNLCELCGANKCNTKYSAPFNDTLKCLTRNDGDIALTTLSYAKTFFSYQPNTIKYQFLCSNGTVSPATKPCTWTNQLNSLIISSSSSAVIMKSYLQERLPSYINNSRSTGSPPTIEAILARVLKLDKTDKINLLVPTPLSNYVSERRHIPTVAESVKCDITLKWSVTGMKEKNKCEWLRQASLNVGLQPVIECVLSSDSDTISNLDNIKYGKADIAFVDANFGYMAKRKGLNSVAYPETIKKQLSQIIIVLRSDDTSWYHGLSDLEGKGVCLPQYGGKEWLAFIDLLRTKRILKNDSCDYNQMFGDFVGNSCAPGANSKDLDIASINQEKLCANCVPVSITRTAKYCNADIDNKYYSSFGALTCLSDKLGDYAIIDVNDLPEMYSKNLKDHQRFTVVSKNGSLASYPGFQVDDQSPISIIISGEIVIKNGSSKYEDAVLYLKSIEYEFGQNPEKAFKVFERFDNLPDQLFPDSTPGLTFEDTFNNKYIENFKTLLSNSDQCGTLPSSSHKILPVFSLVALVLFAFII